MKIQVSKIDHSLSCEIILFGHIYLFIYLKDKIQFTIPHSMEALRMRCTLLAIKIPVAEIQPFPNRWESLVSAYSPGSVTTVLAGKYLMPQSISSRSTLGILGCWKPSTPQASFTLVNCCVTYLFALLLTAVHIFKQIQMPFAHCQMAKFKGCLQSLLYFRVQSTSLTMLITFWNILPAVTDSPIRVYFYFFPFFPCKI